MSEDESQVDSFEELDLTEEGVLNEGDSSNRYGYKESPYDPRIKEDNIRGTISIILVSVLALVILVSLFSVILKKCSFDEIKDVLQILLSPLLALVSAATGFYFGSKK